MGLFDKKKQAQASPPVNDPCIMVPLTQACRAKGEKRGPIRSSLQNFSPAPVVHPSAPPLKRKKTENITTNAVSHPGSVVIASNFCTSPPDSDAQTIKVPILPVQHLSLLSNMESKEGAVDFSKRMRYCACMFVLTISSELELN